MGSGDGEHIIEAIGKCRVVIRNGEVVEVGDPIIKDCPLARRFAYPIPSITKEAVKENIAHRIKSFGMCTERREVTETKEFVGFGASEILSFALHASLLDAVVIACDGAGTVVVSKPELVQGIGGRMSGLVKTTPLPAVIRRIEQHGGIVIDKKGGSIDMPAGVDAAIRQGYKKVAVTVADPGSAEAIRKKYPEVIIMAVHVSGLTHGETERLVAAADLLTSCASKPVREIAGKRALVQAGTAIPIFAVTKKGKELIVEKMARSDEPFVIKTTKLPVAGDSEPNPLV